MGNILFNNEQEETNFYNVKAHQRLIDLENARENLDNEIDSIIKSSGELLKKYGARTNFVEELYSLDLEIEKLQAEEDSKEQTPTNSADTIREYKLYKQKSSKLEELLAARDSLAKEFDLFKDGLPLSDKLNVVEELNFKYDTQLSNRKTKTNENDDVKNAIIEAFPDSETVDNEQIPAMEPFKAIYAYLNPNDKSYDIKDVEEEKQVEKPAEAKKAKVVKKIIQAPGKLLNSLKLEEKAKGINSPKTEVEDTPIMDNSFFGEDDSLIKKMENPADEKIVLINTKKDEIKPIESEIQSNFILDNENTDEKIEISPIIEDTKDEVSEPALEEITPINFEEPSTDVITPIINEDPTEETAELTYTLENGESLSSLAAAICGDENGWMDIYSANKELIENTMKQKGVVDNQNIENNDKLFSGLTLNIPNIFKKEMPKELEKPKEMKLAA